MKTTTAAEPKYDAPTIVSFCVLLGWISLVVGGGAVLLAVTIIIGEPAPHPPDTLSVFVIFLSICVSSIFWFALGRIIDSLAEIAYNTREHLPPHTRPNEP